MFDGVGDQTRLTYPGGRIVDKTFDAGNLLDTVSDQDGPIADYAYVGPARVARRD